MENTQKISFRFYNDHEVRAVWDDNAHKWFFPVVDIIAAITESDAPRKYWSVLKLRLKKQGNELATNCSQLKIRATDGKRYNGALTDKISDREIFMKGIDYSYYYEQEE